MKTNNGFTLIEALVYIALLGLIMTGAVAVAYQLVDSSAAVNIKNTAGEEGNFVLRKLDWALSSASALDTSVTNQLTVSRYDGTTVIIKLSGTEIEMKETGGTFLPITTGNVTVSDLSFQNIPAVGGAPQGVTAATTINGLNFVMTRYIRN